MSESEGGGVVPTWLPTSVSGFRNLVLGVLTTSLVGWLIGGAESLISSVVVLWESIGTVGGSLGSWLVGVAELVASIPTGVVAIARRIVLELAVVSGPAAPIVVPIAWGAFVLGLVFVLRLAWSSARGLIGVMPWT